MPATPNPGGTRAIPASGGRALSAPPAIYSRGLVSLTARTVPGSLPWSVRGTSAAPPPALFRAFCVDEGCRGSCRTGCWVSTSDPLPVEGGAVPPVAGFPLRTFAGGRRSSATASPCTRAPVANPLGQNAWEGSWSGRDCRGCGYWWVFLSPTAHLSLLLRR